MEKHQIFDNSNNVQFYPKCLSFYKFITINNFYTVMLDKVDYTDILRVIKSQTGVECFLKGNRHLSIYVGDKANDFFYTLCEKMINGN